MDETKIEWSDRFNIGIDTIDKAHRRLFSIVGRIFTLNNENSEKARFACKEGIKYFKNYAVKHFSEEEAYMQSVHYAGYENHKKVHDDLREKTLTALEEEMESSDYSSESIQHFLGICLGWLTAHVLIEDHAITGKASSKWTSMPEDNEQEALEKGVGQIIMDLFGLNAKVISQCYNGENFGSTIYYSLSYTVSDGKKLQVYLGYEGKLILYILSAMLGRKIPKIDKVVVDAVGQISRRIMRQLRSMVHSIDQFQKLESIIPISQEQLKKAFGKEYPHYSMLFDTGEGYFMLCIKDL